MKIIRNALALILVGTTGLIHANVGLSDIVIVDHDEVPPPGDADVILDVGEAPAQFPKSASGSVTDYRCEHDSLDPATSRARLLWAGENKIIPASLVFKWLYRVENNQVVMNARPYYPMFGTWNGRPNDTQVWKPEDYGMPKHVPAGKVWVAICRASCLTPEQKILTDKGYMRIDKAEKRQHPSIVTLADASEMEHLSFQKSDVLKYTASFQDAFHVILSFHTQSGGTIRVTPNHTLLNQEGRIVEASSMKVGDSLVSTNSNLDRIESIRVTSYFGKVYNIRPTATDRKSNVVVAQGFLTGSDRYQNEYFDLIQDQAISSQIDESLIP
jgi:hypothetical protein